MNEPRRKQWESEPDHVEMECMVIQRHPTSKHLCGYVGIGSGNSLYGLDTNAVYAAAGLDVHGGVTYAEDHAPNSEQEGLWWFGFDCAHLGDHIPNLTTSNWQGDVYRDMEFVKQECISLAKQLIHEGVNQGGSNGTRDSK